MFYHHYKNIENIAKSEINYNLVIYLRFDMIVKNPLTLLINNNYCNIPDGSDHLGVNDQLAVGSMSIMKQYGSIYKYLSDYVQKFQIFHPEQLIKIHIKEQKIPINRFPFEYILKKK